jgi:hypothetical protein
MADSKKEGLETVWYDFEAPNWSEIVCQYQIVKLHTSETVECGENWVN